VNIVESVLTSAGSRLNIVGAPEESNVNSEDLTPENRLTRGYQMMSFDHHFMVKYAYHRRRVQSEESRVKQRREKGE